MTSTLWVGGAVALANEAELILDFAGGDGTLLTADATVHTKGAWVEMDASVGFDVTSFHVGSNYNAANNTDTGQLLDIGIGSEGNEKVLVADIPCGYGALNGVTHAEFPIFIPKGTRISGRIQATITVDTVEIVLYLFGGRSWYGETFQVVDTMGAKTALSGGTDLEPGGIIEIVASTPNHYKALGLVFDLGQASSSGGGSTRDIEIFVGAVSSEKSLIAELDYTTGTGENVVFIFPFHGFIPMRFNIPAGTRLSAQSVGSRGNGLVISGYR